MAKASNAYNGADFQVPNFSQLYAEYSRMFGDFGKLFGNSKAPFMDVEAVIATQRKNVEALSVANKLAFDGAQAVARRQAELVRQGFDDLTKLGRDLTAAGSPEDKFVRQTEIAKESFEAAIGSFRELTAMLQKSNFEAVDVLSKRVADNLDEMKAAFTPRSA